MAKLVDDDHHELFEEMALESPGTIGRNIIRRFGVSQSDDRGHQIS